MRRRLLTEELWGGGVRTAYEAEAGDVVGDFIQKEQIKEIGIYHQQLNLVM